MKRITKEELQEAIKLHSEWLEDESKGKRMDFSNADLTGADLRWASLTGADLRWASLTGADLRWASLTGASLTGADLTGADLRGASLTGADLTWADLRGASLTGADLRWADLDYSCLPLWCGSFGMKVSDDFGYQILLHFVKMEFESEEMKKLQETLKPYAEKCHLVKDGEVKL